MSSSDSLNIASLHMVHDELIATIEQSASYLEQFSQDRDNAELLQSCIDAIRQIRGTLHLIELRGVDLLADELLQHITNITLGEDIGTQKKLDQITSNFFTIPRYLEYCTQVSHALPSLLLPAINELRSLRGAKLLPESYYAKELVLLSADYELSVTLPDDWAQIVRRLRHMFQTGLLSVLKDAQVLPSINMMERALKRLMSLAPNTALADFFHVAGLLLQVFQQQELKLTKPRKLLFSALDREIKRFQFEGVAIVNRKQDDTLVRELIFLLRLSHSKNSAVIDYLTHHQLGFSQYGEADLAREAEFLNGPSLKTISSMVVALQEEINTIKNSLERAALSGAELIIESPEFIENLKNVAEILRVIGLVSPAEGLANEIQKIVAWQESNTIPTHEELTQVADTLLYVESTILGLDQANLSDEKVAQLNALSRDDAMSSSQILEAEKIVIDEVESGVTLVKRGISSFIESGCDRGHIHNLLGTLDSVRGGMLVLSLGRAAKVVAACIAFVQQELIENEPHPSIQHQLETYADAIISLEYYIDAVKLNRHADPSVLQIAEESLQALGYPV